MRGEAVWGCGWGMGLGSGGWGFGDGVVQGLQGVTLGVTPVTQSVTVSERVIDPLRLFSYIYYCNL